MATLKQKALNTLARSETNIPEIAHTHLAILKFVNPDVWNNKNQECLELMLYNAISILRQSVMHSRHVHAGSAFTFETACLQVMLHCFSNERPVVKVGITPNHKEYGQGY